MKKTTICYDISTSPAEMTDFVSGGIVLNIVLSESTEGFITLGCVRSAICDGKAELDLSVLTDGIYEPVLSNGESVLHFEKIMLKNGAVTPLLTEEPVIRKLMRRVRALELKSVDCEGRIGMIEEKIRTNVIF